MKINGIYKHVDNGGVSVDVHQSDEDKHLYITFETSYYGYPNITSTLNLWGWSGQQLRPGPSVWYGQSSGEILRELGEMFIKSAEIVEENPPK